MDLLFLVLCPLGCAQFPYLRFGELCLGTPKLELCQTCARHRFIGSDLRLLRGTPDLCPTCATCAGHCAKPVPEGCRLAQVLAQVFRKILLTTHCRILLTTC